jgi:hypothetical protein
MEVEMSGLRNIVTAACQEHGVRRLILRYISGDRT